MLALNCANDNKLKKNAQLAQIMIKTYLEKQKIFRELSLQSRGVLETLTLYILGRN